MRDIEVIPRDPDGERALEAMDRFRAALARGIALPPKMLVEGNAPAQPVWFGIDLAKPEVESK